MITRPDSEINLNSLPFINAHTKGEARSLLKKMLNVKKLPNLILVEIDHDTV